MVPARGWQRVGWGWFHSALSSQVGRRNGYRQGARAGGDSFLLRAGARPEMLNSSTRL